MTITFPCTKCGKQYRATPELCGKQIKCKDCGTLVRVPTPRGTPNSSAVAAASEATMPRAAAAGSAPRGPSASPAGDEVRCPRCRAQCRIMPEWRGMTLECPSCKSRFKVPAASVGSSATADESLFHTEDASDYAPRFAGEEDDLSGGSHPVREVSSPTAHKKKKKKKSALLSGGTSGPVMNWIVGVFFVVGLLVFAWAHTLGFIVAVGAGTLMLFGGGLWLLGVAFHEGVMCGVMYLFVPFYGLYYLISRWDDCKRPFGLAVGGWLLVIAAALLNPEIMLEQGRNEPRTVWLGRFCPMELLFRPACCLSS